MHGYKSRKLHTLIFHAITCITCSLSSGNFASPVLSTSVELVQAETELSSLKTDVMMTANRCSDLTF